MVKRSLFNKIGKVLDIRKKGSTIIRHQSALEQFESHFDGSPFRTDGCLNGFKQQQIAKGMLAMTSGKCPSIKDGNSLTLEFCGELLATFSGKTDQGGSLP